MIPKIIHYCWFGGKPLPDMAKKCIKSWKVYFPDYEIKEWNETNFDVNCCLYVKEAYEEKKWAFVSDYARFWILYNYGGLYFDTDVEVVASLEDIISHGPYMGIEGSTQTDFRGKRRFVKKVNPGLGIAAMSKMPIYAEILEEYEKRHFKQPDGMLDITTVVEYVTNILEKHGYHTSDGIIIVEGISIYPFDFFCPLDYTTGKINKTQNTRTIHWYSSTWFTCGQSIEKRIIQWSSHFGKASHYVERISTFPIRVYNKFAQLGVKNTLKFIIDKMRKKVNNDISE